MENFPYSRVLFDKAALDFELGRKVWQRCHVLGLESSVLKGTRVSGIPGKSPRETYFQGKATLVVSVRRKPEFATCKPSAHFQLPLVSGCPGMCEYCYLMTQMGQRPYTRMYVNIEDILAQAANAIQARLPAVTLFEAAATSDPVPAETLSGALARSIEFFSAQPNGRLRFVTKFPSINSLLGLEHRGHTRIRFSVNIPSVISRFEHRTPELKLRLEALGKVVRAGYPAGILIAPVIMEPAWEDSYRELLDEISGLGLKDVDMKFEIISHRFTIRARNRIMEVFPESRLPLDENHSRQFKFGQFGYGKYVYDKGSLAAMKSFFEEEIAERFPGDVIEYII